MAYNKTAEGVAPENGPSSTWSKLEPLAKWTAVTVLAICTTALVLCGRGEASFMGIMLLMAVIWTHDERVQQQSENR